MDIRHRTCGIRDHRRLEFGWLEGCMKSLLVLVEPASIAAPHSHSLGEELKSAKAKIINGSRQKVGKATLSETRNGVLSRLNLRQNPKGVSPGTHAIHIHNVGN